MGDNFEGPIKSAQGENFEKNFFRNFSKNFESFEKYILGILRPRSRSEINFLAVFFFGFRQRLDFLIFHLRRKHEPSKPQMRRRLRAFQLSTYGASMYV